MKGLIHNSTISTSSEAIHAANSCLQYKPIEASPRRDYGSEEDGISTNSLVLLLSCLGNDTSKKGGSAPRATD
jgi:hypothetical protein